MKKLVITMSLLAGATAAYSQGQINWSDYQAAQSTPPLPAFSIEVFSQNPASPMVQQTGNTSSDLPAGSSTYGGAPLNGAGFEIGLYVGSSAAAANAAMLTGTPIATDTFSSGFAGRWDVSGSLTATDPSNPSGTAVFIGLAAWSTSGGATTYAQALSQQVAAGSETSTGSTVEGGGGTPPAFLGTLAGIGLTSFSLTTTIPEPSTIALGVIGASTFLLRLRRKQ